MNLKKIHLAFIFLLGCSTVEKRNTGEIIPEREPSFYNGVKVNYSDYPYILFLRGWAPGAMNLCGATLIHPRVAVTAAHCIIPNVSDIEVFGANGSANAIYWKQHKKYRGIVSDPIGVDFAYIILDRPINLVGSSKYPKIYTDIANPKEIPIGTSFTAFGAQSNSLWTREVVTKVPMNEDTKTPIRLDYMLRTTPATHSGESGSPLFLFKDKEVYLVGVTHGGLKPNTATGPDLPEYFNIYSYAASALEWIEEQLGYNQNKSIEQNYKSMICAVSGNFGPISLKSILSDFSTNSNAVSCNGIALNQIIEKKESEAAIITRQSDEVTKLEQAGVLSKYSYNKARAAGAEHTQAIEAAKGEQSNLWSTYDYTNALNAGANHDQALEVATAEKKNEFSAYEYAKLRSIGVTHEEAVVVCKADRKGLIWAYDYSKARKAGVSHKDALDMAKKKK